MPDAPISPWGRLGNSRQEAARRARDADPHAVSLAFMAYNFCTPHGTLTEAAGGIKTTPDMAAGVTDRVWTIEDVLARMDPDPAVD